MPAGCRRYNVSAKKLRRVTDLEPDPRNANRGTERGTGLLEQSLRNYGAGRSVVIDRNGRVICGNKTVEMAAAVGIKDLVVVDANGHQLVAVRRTDLDLEHDARARGLAVADNRVVELDLDWDHEALREMATEVDLAGFFTEAELQNEAETDVPDSGPESEERCPACGQRIRRRRAAA